MHLVNDLLSPSNSVQDPSPRARHQDRGEYFRSGRYTNIFPFVQTEKSQWQEQQGTFLQTEDVPEDVGGRVSTMYNTNSAYRL